MSDCRKKNFAQIIYLKFTFFNSWRHQNLELVANQVQDGTFLFKINSKDFSISKLVSQLKLSPSSFELKDNDTIGMSTIFKKLLVMSRNSVFSKPPTNRPPTTDRLPTDHRPLNTDQPTTNQMYWPPTNRPLTNEKSEDQKFYNKL